MRNIFKIDYIFTGIDKSLYYDVVFIDTERSSPIIPFNKFIERQKLDLYSILQIQEEK